MTFSIQDWDKRYLQQAEWTTHLRDYVFQKADLKSSARVLEVGCGTGAILGQIPSECHKFGIDIDFQPLFFIKDSSQNNKLACADAACLPFPNRSFEMVFCHYLLLWVYDPIKVLMEMQRVAKHQGIIAAFAEPDYGLASGNSASIDQIRNLQAKSLTHQGADPFIGRKLRIFFNELGLDQVETSQLNTQSNGTFTEFDLEMELKVISNDLIDYLSENELKRLLHSFSGDVRKFQSLLEVPTFFALGIVK